MTWQALSCFGRLSVWFPLPKVARQVLSFIMETWCEVPLTTSALLFIPRTVPSFWQGISRHLIKLPTIYPHTTPLLHPRLLPIPIVVLYLPPHVRSLSTKNRLDQPPGPAGYHWHRQQAATMRRLPPGVLF